MSSQSDPVSTVTWLSACDLSACDAHLAREVTRKIGAVRGWLDSFEADLACHLNTLYARGEALPATEQFTRDANISKAEADKRNRRAEAIANAPAFGEALSQGEVNAEHTDALANATAKVDEQTKAEFFDHQSELLDRAKHMTPHEFARHCRDEIRRLERDQGIERLERQKRETALRTSICSRTGMYKLNGEFDPETGHKLFKAIEDQMVARLANADQPDTDRHRVAAHALADLIFAGKGEVRPTVVDASVIIDWQTLQSGVLESGSICELADGTPMPVESIRRLLCEAAIFPVVLGADGVTLDVGRERRVATPAQRRALRAMYASCGVRGCHTRFDRCEMHHILEWDKHRGPTDLRNLLPLCPYHHHLVHEGQWKLELDEHRTLTITLPNGEVYMVCELEHRRRTTDQTVATLVA